MNREGLGSSRWPPLNITELQHVDVDGVILRDFKPVMWPSPSLYRSILTVVRFPTQDCALIFLHRAEVM